MILLDCFEIALKKIFMDRDLTPKHAVLVGMTTAFLTLVKEAEPV